jgi:uncharacterized protein (TIGR00369 family)
MSLSISASVSAPIPLPNPAPNPASQESPRMHDPEIQRPPIMTADDLTAFFDREFPQLSDGNDKLFELVSVGPMTAVMRMLPHIRNLRPGGTVSGPAMFALADVALYAAILAQIGPVGLTVTTTMTMNFLNKPPPGPLLGEARLLKLGKRLAVGEVYIRAPGVEAPAAHATGTYSIPTR